MEEEILNKEDQSNYSFGHPKNFRLGGLIIVLAGIILLLSRIPQTAGYFPAWLFTWPVLLIVFGIYIGAIHGFRHSPGWLIWVFIGVGFLLYQQQIISAPLSLYILPAALIAAGLIIVFRKNHNRPYLYERWRKRKGQHLRQMSAYVENRKTHFAVDNNDAVNINATFSSVDKRISSKNFQGGKISCSFGSCELDLTQADFEETATIDISINFGSVEIMLPSNWTVQNELATVVSAVDDVRMKTAADFEKTLVLKGSVSFGSIEIRN